MTKTSDTQPPGGESFRVPIDCVVDVRLKPSSDWVKTSATNISMSGMFLRTAQIQERDTQLDVKFRLQHGQAPIQTKVEVLWSRVRDTGPETPRGLGVRFLDLDLESKYAISRLVDRYQQLGRTPFHLTPADEENQVQTAGTKPDRATLFLAFAAGAVSGVLASYLWLAKPGELEKSTAQVTETAQWTAAAIATPSSPASPPGEGPEPQFADVAKPKTEPAPTLDPGSASPRAAVSVDPVDAIETAVQTWAQAWAGKDIDRYLSAYLDDFTPASGLPHDAWEAQRRQRLSRAGSIEVNLSALEIDILAPKRAVVRFDQAYSRPGYQDQVKKQLELVLHERVWKIFREEVL